MNARTHEPVERNPSAWISVAVERLVAEFGPLRVVLFGSRARGDARPDSDVDLLVVMPRLDNKRRLTRAMLHALDDRVVPVDIVVTDPHEIERRGDLVGSVLRPALREGQVLYERP